MSALNDNDRERLDAIGAAVEVQDAPRVVALVREYYGDADRCDRTPRSVLILHTGMVLGLLDAVLTDHARLTRTLSTLAEFEREFYRRRQALDS